jgi:hypothetical protein
LKKYIKSINNNWVFQTWSKHIVEAFSIDFNSQENPLKEKPSFNSSSINKDDEEFYHPVKVQGEWLQVKWGEENNWKFAWIRWKREGKLIIDLFYFA